jgi:hypothetical protein
MGAGVVDGTAWVVRIIANAQVIRAAAVSGWSPTGRPLAVMARRRRSSTLIE